MEGDNTKEILENLYHYFSPEGLPVPNQNSNLMLQMDIMVEHYKRKEDFFQYLDDTIETENPGMYDFIRRRVTKVFKLTGDMTYATTTKEDMQLFYLLLSYDPVTREREPDILPKIDDDTITRVEQEFNQDRETLAVQYQKALETLELTNNGAYRYINHMVEEAPEHFQRYTLGSLVKQYELLRNEKVQDNLENRIIH